MKIIPGSSLPSPPCRIHLTEESVSQSNRHSLVLNVVVQSVLTELTADTRLLEATEWKLVVKGVVCVDPDLCAHVSSL